MQLGHDDATRREDSKAIHVHGKRPGPEVRRADQGGRPTWSRFNRAAAVGVMGGGAQWAGARWSGGRRVSMPCLLKATKAILLARLGVAPAPAIAAGGRGKGKGRGAAPAPAPAAGRGAPAIAAGGRGKGKRRGACGVKGKGRARGPG